MNPYLSEKARGEIPRFLKWLRNAGLAFCVFCSFGGLYTLCLDLQTKDTSHVGGYVLWIVVGGRAPGAVCPRGGPPLPCKNHRPQGGELLRAGGAPAVAMQQRWHGHQRPCMVF